tara:strand:- start:961 stop:1632 length:672 start_codon:yes stop_codon:yes gene_type:complete
MTKAKKMKPGKLKGPSHKNGGILLEAEGGEYIIKKSSVKKLGKATLDKINKEGKLPMKKPAKKKHGGMMKKYYKKGGKVKGFEVMAPGKARTRRALGVTPDVNPDRLPNTPEGDMMRELTKRNMKYSEKGKAKLKLKQERRKKEIAARRERLKRNKKAGTGPYAKMEKGGMAKKGMKKVDKKKNPGLAKLPKPVRNKMGYSKKGGMVGDSIKTYASGGYVEGK